MRVGTVPASGTLRGTGTVPYGPNGRYGGAKRTSSRSTSESGRNFTGSFRVTDDRKARRCARPDGTGLVP